MGYVFWNKRPKVICNQNCKSKKDFKSQFEILLFEILHVIAVDTLDELNSA